MVGNIKGVRKELDSKAVRRSGCSTGHDQTIFSRRRQRAEEDLPGKVAGAAIVALCSITLHTNNGHTDKDVRDDANQSR